MFVEEKSIEEKFDTKILTTKLENDNYDDEKFNFVVIIIIYILYRQLEVVVNLLQK
jgi:hypothetical protein